MTEADKYTDYQKMKGRVLDRALKIFMDLKSLQTDKDAGARFTQRILEGRCIFVSQVPLCDLLKGMLRMIGSTVNDLTSDTTIDPAKDIRSTTPNEKGRELVADILRNNNITILH